MTINLEKWWHILIGVVPLMTAIVTTAIWLDQRHLSSRDAYLQNITLQILIIEGHITDYERAKNLNFTPSDREIAEYHSNKYKLDILRREKDCFIGLISSGCNKDD